MNKKLTLSFVGGLLLFFSWITQEFLFEKWNNRLSEIDEAQSKFIAYQSNNAIFNAIYEITPAAQQERIRSLQTINYTFGLLELRKSLSRKSLEQLRLERPDEAEILNPAIQFSGDIQKRIHVQGELNYIIELIQNKFENEKQAIENHKSQSQKSLWILYILGSLLILFENLSPDQDKIEQDKGT